VVEGVRSGDSSRLITTCSAAARSSTNRPAALVVYFPAGDRWCQPALHPPAWSGPGQGPEDGATGQGTTGERGGSERTALHSASCAAWPRCWPFLAVAVVVSSNPGGHQTRQLLVAGTAALPPFVIAPNSAGGRLSEGALVVGLPGDSPSCRSPSPSDCCSGLSAAMGALIQRSGRLPTLSGGNCWPADCAFIRAAGSASRSPQCRSLPWVPGLEAPLVGRRPRGLSCFWPGSTAPRGLHLFRLVLRLWASLGRGPLRAVRAVPVPEKWSARVSPAGSMAR